MNTESTSRPSSKTARHGRQRRRAIVNGLQNALLVIMLLVILTPIALMLLTSVRPRTDIVSSTAPLFPRNCTSRTTPKCGTYIKFGPLFRNSLVVVSITTVIATFFAAMAGYAWPASASRRRCLWPHRHGHAAYPGHALLHPALSDFLWLKNTFGLPLLGTNFGAIVLYIGFYTPISLWILRASSPRSRPTSRSRPWSMGPHGSRLSENLPPTCQTGDRLHRHLRLHDRLGRDVLRLHPGSQNRAGRHPPVRARCGRDTSALRLHCRGVGGHHHPRRANVFMLQKHFIRGLTPVL